MSIGWLVDYCGWGKTNKDNEPNKFCEILQFRDIKSQSFTEKIIYFNNIVIADCKN